MAAEDVYTIGVRDCLRPIILVPESKRSLGVHIATLVDKFHHGYPRFLEDLQKRIGDYFADHTELVSRAVLGGGSQEEWSFVEKIVGGDGTVFQEVNALVFREGGKAKPVRIEIARYYGEEPSEVGGLPTRGEMIRSDQVRVEWEGLPKVTVDSIRNGVHTTSFFYMQQSIIML